MYYPDLSADLGGVMGLLLGASVMTICEVLDLFLYNGIAKLVKKNERQLALDGRKTIRQKEDRKPSQGIYCSSEKPSVDEVNC